MDTVHSEVIAKLPPYARSTSIGWRFMDKFVQLPFMIPPPEKGDLKRYIESLFSQEEADVTMEVLDIAARVVEASTASAKTSDQVVMQVSSEQPLDSEQQRILKEEVKIIQGMSEDIKEFADQDNGIISANAILYFDNPRDAKRFVNLYRFCFFLRSARKNNGQWVPSEDQLCRGIALSLRWPEVTRWLRRHPAPQDDSADTSLKALERLGGSSQTIEDWQASMKKTFGLSLEQTGWLADEKLHSVLKREFSEVKEEDRLSSCVDGGLWWI